MARNNTPPLKVATKARPYGNYMTDWMQHYVSAARQQWLGYEPAKANLMAAELALRGNPSVVRRRVNISRQR